MHSVHTRKTDPMVRVQPPEYGTTASNPAKVFLPCPLPSTHRPSTNVYPSTPRSAHLSEPGVIQKGLSSSSCFHGTDVLVKETVGKSISK